MTTKTKKRCQAGMFAACGREAEPDRCNCGCGHYLCTTHNAVWLEAKREQAMYAKADALSAAKDTKPSSDEVPVEN